MTQLSIANLAQPSTELLMAVLHLARQASTAIMQVYASEFAVENKLDDSPLTLADREAHRIIATGLQQLTPTIPVLSEESPAEQHQFTTRHHWPTLWLVDPLDGTREFIKRNGEFTVNIALIHEQRPVLGVVAIPAAEVAYVGAVGLGAHRIDEQAAQPIHTHRPARQTPIVVGSRSHRAGSLDALLVKLGKHQLCAVGSALKFCRVAEGAADFYPRLGPTSEWDTAAGQAVLEAAGGQVLNLQGKPLTYNQRDTLLNPHFMAIGDPQFAWQQLLVPPC
ncbi:MAG: 3'(2'),5'-bisphosphate nucleotidase CysQ [Steroidobacteraceae bacterium]